MFIASRAINKIQAAIDTLNHASGAAGPVVVGNRIRKQFVRRFHGADETIGGGFPIETPVARIRNRSHAGGMGLLSLAALTFAAAKDADAGDANITVLDEDRITFKDMPHGAFELTTKEAIPRYLIVEDPGETVVLSRSGSSISVNQFANSAARMEELQAAQQEVYANFTKGLGTGGSGTTPFSDTLPVQPINFTQPHEPAQLNSLPALPAVETREEFIFIPKPAEQPVTFLTLNLGSGLTETDTVVFDTFTATSGTFGASSSASGALTYGISGGITGNTVLDGVAYNVSKAGDYGTLYLNSSTGAYTFVPNDAAINALKTPTTASFGITVSDGTMSASQTFTIDINGVNDEAIIAGDVTGSLTEASGIAGSAAAHACAPRIATGTLTSTDVDDPPNAFTEVNSPTASDGGYGKFTITAGGVWAYALDNGNSAVQALNVGDTLTDTFTVTTVDGTRQVVTIVIDGANDPAVICGETTGSVVEAACKDPGIPTATGTLTSTDVDNPSNLFTPVKCGESDGGYGTFTMTKDGVWTYKLDNDNCAVQALDDCDTLTDTFTVTTVDGTEQVITITIQGADDGHGHHHHSDHEKWTHETFASSDAAAASGKESVVGKKLAGFAATQAETKAVVGSSPAAAPDAGDSFRFREQWSDSPAPKAVVTADGHQASVSWLAEVHGASGTVEAIQVQHISEHFDAEAGQKVIAYHAAHELMV